MATAFEFTVASNATCVHAVRDPSPSLAARAHTAGTRTGYARPGKTSAPPPGQRASRGRLRTWLDQAFSHAVDSARESASAGSAAAESAAAGSAAAGSAASPRVWEATESWRCLSRYNPENLATLERYVETQAKENAYDLEANLAVLKLSFPSNYWDKFVKRKVLDKHRDICGREWIAELLGMDLSTLEITAHSERKPEPPPGLLIWLMSIGVKYQIWKFGVIFTDNSFLNLGWYMVMSLLGHYNNFFFAAHLLDIAMGVKTLRTILSSVTHDGKQLVMTVGLLAVVLYLYTVVAFNFFRKLYSKSEDEDEPDMKCDDMMTCYLFHMYVGVRAGGGIGDEIEDPAGDEYELYRVVFDITFFFFVIVILLAIIQGLITDALGELRDQQQQVRDNMETKCFICGISIGSDDFDTTLHGFETHMLEEHNLENYMFFLKCLINKDETEHTGQESYVWKMYQERCWDVSPAGDCFRKQYEDQLS
ncbi:LOW QUALITY PROTEIN: ryanodine receptor 1-like [Camelus bactrianus]|uniref:LOW QUALITY PROTEIN: ryanodine receptor 1-like n=1 Tax=Camelus bactrianus TaxID=9837 RepID=A0AC58P1X0_CAMBA